jgi:hypothetical protein
VLLGAIGLIAKLARCFTDGRDPDQVVHTLRTLQGQRVLGLCLGYEDLNDHDQIRRDPPRPILAPATMGSPHEREC